MTDNEIKLMELDKTVRENEIVRQINENRRIQNEISRESAETERDKSDASRADRFESSMAEWRSDVDSLLATGSTYEARISALEAIVRHANL